MMDAKNSFGLDHPSLLTEITTSCEKVVTETQNDLKDFRLEHEVLKQQIITIMNENKHFNSKLEALKAESSHVTADSNATELQYGNEALSVITENCHHLRRENMELKKMNNLSQKKIGNLEKEIQLYKKEIYNLSTEDGQNIAATLKMLEGTIKQRENDIKKKSDIIKKQAKLMEDSNIRITEMQNIIEVRNEELALLREKEESLKKVQELMQEASNNNNKLKNSLHMANQTIEDISKREQIAFQKVQQALAIAESAEAERDEALEREKICREECDKIASTVGKLIDDAAKTFQQKEDDMKKKFKEKENTLIEAKNKLADEIQNQRLQYSQLEEKYKKIWKENKRLSKQLEVAQRNVNELQQELRNPELLKRYSYDQDAEIQHYVNANRQLKERYHAIFAEMTETLKQSIKSLKSELSDLKSEKNALTKPNLHEGSS